MNDKPEVKSLLWLVEQFPAVERPQDDISRMQSCIHRYCTNAVNLIRRMEAENDILCNSLHVSSQNLENMTRAMSNIAKATRNATIKELEEKLKSHKRRMCGNDNGGLYWDQAVLVDDIDRALKELTEDKE